MQTIKMKSQKLSNADVAYISVVDRGANRIPFKIVKQEKGMSRHFAGLDLGNLFTRKSDKSVDEPKIVGVVTMKAEGFESVKQQISEAGFETGEQLEMEDGSVVFKQSEDEINAEDNQIVRVSDHVAIITKGFSPYIMDVSVGEVSFADKVKAEGFYPSMRSITEVLTTALFQAVEHSANPADAAASAAKVFDEAKAYAETYLKTLPVKAFKLEEIQPEQAAAEEAPEGSAESGADESVEKADKKKQKEKEKEGEMDKKPETEEGAEAEEGKEGDSDKFMADGEYTPAEEEEGEAEEGEDDTEKPAKRKAKKADDSLTPEMLASIVSKQVEASVENLTAMVQKAMGQMEDQVKGLSDRVAKAEDSAEETQAVLKGTVVHGSEMDDHVPAKKSEKGGVFGGRDIDTAFMPHVRKRASR